MKLLEDMIDGSSFGSRFLSFLVAGEYDKIPLNPQDHLDLTILKYDQFCNFWGSLFISKRTELVRHIV